MLSVWPCVTRTRGRRRSGREGAPTSSGRCDYSGKPRIEQENARCLVREDLETFTAPLMQTVKDRITDDTRTVVNDCDWLLLPDSWYRGRVVVISDAAHATTADLAPGAGMAIEDGVVLGQEVAAGGSVAELLRRFARRRFERARLVVETSVEIGRLQG